MRNILYLILVIISLFGCNSKQLRSNSSISKEDSTKLEEALRVLKKWNFVECYSLSETNTYKRMGIDLSSRRVKNLSLYYYINNTSIDLHYVFEDQNRKRLVEKWVNKEGYIPFVNPPDFPDGSLDMVRALDFYNSEDMRVYIDSVRQVELKRISESESTMK